MDNHDVRTALESEIEQDAAYLVAAMLGLSDRFRELASGDGLGFEPNRRYREGTVTSGGAITELAEQLAAQATIVVGLCATLDAKKAVLGRLSGAIPPAAPFNAPQS
jgi:hypothetical protein